MIPPTIPCLCGSLRRASRAVSRLYEEHLTPAGLTGTQFTLLMVMRSAGPLNQKQIAGSLLADATTLSRTLAPMVDAGWLCVETGKDRRERHWAITPDGARKLRQALPRWEAAQEAMRQRLGAESWATLKALLDRAGAVAA